MMRAAFLLAGLSAIAFAMPAAAQSGHAGHGKTPPAPTSVPERAAPAGHGEHGEMDKPAGAACPPEHAAMGHCKPADETPATDAVGTDLPAGDAPAPAPPADWYADRIYPKGEMEHSRHMMMAENGAQRVGFISLNLAEYQARKGRDGFRWEGEAWYGGDINRLTLKSEGETAFGEGIESGEAQALYSRAIGPYFNAQAGVRQDFG